MSEDVSNSEKPPNSLDNESSKRKKHAKESNYKYECPNCSRKFSTLYVLRKHELKIHQIRHMPLCNKRCLLCDRDFPKGDFLRHLYKEHSLKVETVTLKFKYYAAFLKWKTEMERDTLTDFCQERGARKNDINTIHYFTCGRSGKYVPTGKGVRNLKTQGSNKIGGYCPAHIKVMENKEGECLVYFMKTHVGHLNNDQLNEFKSKEAKRVARKKLECVLEELSVRHRESQLASNVIETTNGWRVSLADDTDYFSVKLAKESCPCQMICSECNFCVHKYKCSCLESRFKLKMCKHAHIVGQFVKHGSSAFDNIVDNLDISENCDVESPVINEELDVTVVGQEESLQKLKDDLTAEVQTLFETVSTKEEIEVLQNTLWEVQIAIQNIRNTTLT